MACEACEKVIRVQIRRGLTFPGRGGGIGMFPLAKVAGPTSHAWRPCGIVGHEGNEHIVQCESKFAKKIFRLVAMVPMLGMYV